MKNLKQKITRYLTVLLIAVLCCKSTFINVPKSMAAESEESIISDATQFPGWDKEDITIWDGIQWKTVTGMNYINRIDITRCGLTVCII